MNDRLAWLSRTVEAVIDPDLPICDPHHHLWEFPDNRYLLDEFLGDVAGHRIERTVFVECEQKYRQTGPVELRPVGETEFVHQITAALHEDAARTKVAAGIVGFADMTLGPAVQDVLEAHMNASARFRGIRHATAWDASERIRNAHTDPPEGLLRQPTFRQGIERLRDLGLSFDAWLFHPQIPDVIDLARAFPDLTIVLNHAGGPLGIGPYAGKREEVFAVWRRNMIDLAPCENVVLKLGGLSMTMSGFGWHKREFPPGSSELAAAMRPYFETCVEYFGTGRCMFESNFPVEQASCSYTILWNAFKTLAQHCSSAERSELFHDVAARIYKLER